MDLENDFRPFLAMGLISLICMLIVDLGGISVAGVWMDSMYPIFFLFAISGFSIGWIRWKKHHEKS
jgi:hypothetical protein|tara:strand:- start:736 stop:933 length:198 start_codon:yes stop_codon:yes gene_type:complete